jgi:hypothetical protein
VSRHIFREGSQTGCPSGKYQDNQQGKVERKSCDPQDSPGAMVFFGTLRFIHGH